MIAVIVVALLVVLVLGAIAASQVAWLLSGGGRPRGLAPGFEVLRTMSATAVRLRGRYTRPGLRITRRTPVREVGIELARAGRRWLYAAVEDVVLVFAPPRTGKALALDTPIATPSGWTTMGEVEVGHQVFDRHGEVCTVVAVSEVFHDHTCYNVTTNDGEVITADAGHRWVAKLDKRSPERVHTTEVLARHRSKKASIAPAAPLDLPAADLPISPYLFGVWLGDGRASDSRIYTDDTEVMTRIEAEGYTVRKTERDFEWVVSRTGERRSAIILATTLVSQGMSGAQARIQAGLALRTPLPVPTPQRGRAYGPRAASVGRRVRSVKEDLRALGVLGRKHIPLAYFRGSQQQRLGLLQGIVDSDGYVDPAGYVEVTSTNEQLALDVRELVFSLGRKASITKGEATLNGRRCGAKYRVSFYMKGAAFLPRKAVRCRDATAARRARYVRAEQTASVPTKCIAVDSPTRTFLAGRSLLPTHNTALLAAQAQDAPGACLITSTRPDIHEHTIAAREEVGPVEVFNPEDVGGVTSTARWDPVAGCDDPAQAIMRAGYLLSGSAAAGVSDRQYWEGQAHRALRCLLMAAELDGKNMHAVVRWASLEHDRPVEVLKSARVAPGWADELRRAQALVPKTRDAISSTLTLALQFMAVPALAYAATPPRGEGLDVADFLARRGTLYLLGAQREHAPISPLLAAFTGHLFETAKSVAARQRGGRLDPPLTLVLDEAARVCRVPLERWTADAGGSGIPIIIAVQGPDQLYDVWGQDAGGTIWTNAAVKVAFGGLQSGRHLDELSKLCGLRWHLRDGKLERVPVLEPAQIVQLRDLEVLVLRKNTGPVLAWIRPVWNRRPQPHAESSPAPERDWTGPLATVIRLADWRRRRDQRERDAS